MVSAKSDNLGRNARNWLVSTILGNCTIRANTKSEARAVAAKYLGVKKLPKGSKAEEVKHG